MKPEGGQDVAQDTSLASAVVSLKHIKVLELTSTLSGPYAALLLSDMGADVVKVESVKGDTARDLGPRVHSDMGAVFMNANRGKRSVVLDLHSDEGQDQLLQLSDRADVFLHNMRPDAVERCGAGAERLRADHPELVYCGIRGYGSQGIYRDWSAYDDTIQGAAGIAAQQAWVAGSPQYIATALADKVSGLTAAFAIASALVGRSVSGVGCVVEIPMFESVAAFGMLEHLWGRTFRPSLGEARYPRISSPLRRPYDTLDGKICVVVYTREHWRSFFDIIDRPELSDDDRFATLRTRTEHQADLTKLVRETICKRTTEDWLERLGVAGIPACRYNTVDDLFDDPHLKESGLFVEVDHPSEGRLTQIPTPIRIDGVVPTIDRLAPRLGEHTGEVLGELED